MWKYYSNTTIVRALLVEGEYLYAGTEGVGVYRSSNRGQNWEETNTGLADIATYDFTHNDDYLYMGTSAGVYRSSDEGNTWTLTNKGLSNTNVHKLAINDQYIYTGTTDKGIYRSSDKGSTWEATNLNSGNVYDITIGNQYMYAGLGVRMYGSSDNGKNWQDLGLKSSSLINDITLYNEYVYVATGSEGVQRASINSNTWEAMNQGLANRNIRALASDEKYIYAGTTTGVYRSSDMGQNWQSTTGWVNEKITTLVINGDYIYAGTLTDGVYRSSDKGNSWEAINQGLYNQIIFMLRTDNKFIYAGTSNGVWKLDLNSLTSIDEQEDTPPQLSFDITPNPANDNVLFSIHQNSLPAMIEIFSSQGEKIFEYSLQNTSYHYSTDNIPSGMYYCIVRSENHTIRKTLSVIK